DKADKFYFKKDPFEGIPFPKMKTYGLAALITNDATPTKSKYGDKIKFDILYEKDREYAEKIARFLEDKNKKLKFYSFEDGVLKQNPFIDGSSKKRIENTGGESEIFLDAPYTKTTKLMIDPGYLEKGEKVCYLTGESFKKLVDTKNTSPFFSGIVNFNSCCSSRDKQVSWKAMYLSRFSPKLSFYSYTAKHETLMVYLFTSNNLVNLEKLYRHNLCIYKNSIDLKDIDYRANFDLYNWGSDSRDFYTEQYEFLFMLIYTFYKNFLETSMIDISDKSQDLDLFAGSEYEKIPISLVFFKADKFSGTMRPNFMEELDNFKFIIRMFYFFEDNNINLRNLLSSLKFIKPTEAKSKKKSRLERIIRNNVLEKIIKTKSTIKEIENLFFDCYKQLTRDKSIGYKDFGQLMKFVSIYEKFINYGGDLNMNPELQEKAINLGTSIGQGILNFDNPNYEPGKTKTNAKNGRGYIISLKKARNLQQFLDEIIRLQTKYRISVSRDLLKQIDKHNFNEIKQFAIISALNQLNSILNFKKKENENETK
ncbi:MAG: hypothetical protein KAT34_03735, partial [Candidatus Aminicenantes bacterium]|nr:hypothetical protein [Candidatus Aminicenantes bacterium]